MTTKKKFYDIETRKKYYQGLVLEGTFHAYFKAKLRKKVFVELARIRDKENNLAKHDRSNNLPFRMLCRRLMAKFNLWI